MSWSKDHDFYKTSVVLNKYNSDDIWKAKDYVYKTDNLHFRSDRNYLRICLIEIFDALNDTFNLEFMLNDEEIDSWEEAEDKQTIFSLEKQIEVIESINRLYSKIEEKHLKIDCNDLSIFIQEAKSYDTSELPLDIEYNASMRETILTLELIRRFFEESIKENKIIVKFEIN